VAFTSATDITVSVGCFTNISEVLGARTIVPGMPPPLTLLTVLATVTVCAVAEVLTTLTIVVSPILLAAVNDAEVVKTLIAVIYLLPMKVDNSRLVI
jgi:hypothetical protein